MKEASILKSLKHPNIPLIYDIEEDEMYSYIIEEYLQGESLESYINNPENRNKKNVINLAIQVCDLLGYLHQGENPVLYLDLKPGNLLVEQNVLKLFDFGAAVRWDERDKYGGFSFGTRGYAAPEQYEGLICTDTRSDIYGFGMLFFYMMTGESYGTAGEQRLKEEIKHPSWGKEYARILKKCLKQSPKERFQTIEELMEELLWLKETNTYRKIGRSAGKEILSGKKEAFTIAVAGAQCRIGTTHTGIMIALALAKKGIPCAYIERNDGHVVDRLLEMDRKKEEGICHKNGCTFVANRNWQIGKVLSDPAYQGYVLDMGVLDQENQNEFYQADYPCLVVGCKFWEDLSWMENDDLCYLVNFATADFENRITRRRKKKCLRLPYQPDPFMSGKKDKNAEEMEEFVEDLIGKREKGKFLPWKR